MKHLVFLALTMMVIAACGNKKETTASTVEAATEKPMEQETAFPSIIVDMKNESTVGDNYSINSVEPMGDYLTINVSYSGGCETHDWKLMTNGAMMKSLPPQMNITLWHDNNGDNCRGLITEDLTFDLTKIQAGESGTIILHLRNHDPKIVYIY